jgi:hypothetical protein
VRRVERTQSHLIGGFAAVGAGVLHATAIGLHAEKPQLARVFMVLTLFQVAVGAAHLIRPRISVLVASLVVNSVAATGWVVTRISSVSWIDGLENRESPQIADTVCAGLGLVAVGVALGHLVAGSIDPPTRKSLQSALPIAAIGIAVVVGMWSGASHVHDHGDDHADNGDHHAASEPTSTDGGQSHSADSDEHGSADHGDDVDAAAIHGLTANWPRPYDPAVGVDISGVPDVSPEQEARAMELIMATQKELPQWADYDSAVAQGWVSIGDDATGHEHLVNRFLIVDGKFLDPTAPESLVYEVKNGTKTLVSAMFMADVGVPVDDPMLTEFAGPLMQWHVHDNLCFRIDPRGRSVVAGVLDAQGNCPPGSTLGGIGIAMVHVWIAPHPCGPFAALEGEGAGRAAVSDEERVDLCDHAHTE